MLGSRSGVSPSEYRKPVAGRAWGLNKVSVMADGEPFGVVAATMAAEAGCSVVVPSGIDGTVTLALDDVDAETAFRRLAESVGYLATLTDGVVSFSKGKTPVKEAILIPPSYEPAMELVEALKMVVTEAGGDVRAVGDRVMVVGSGQSSGVVADLMEQLQVGPDGWLLEVRVVQVVDTLREELGLGITGSGKLDAAVGVAQEPFRGTASLVGNAGVAAVMKAAAEGVRARLLTVGSLYVLEGRKGEFKQGDRIPIPQRVTSPEGTVSTTGYTFVETGFTLIAEGRRVPQGLLLELTPTLSSVTGYVGEAPIVAQRSVSGSVVLRSGDWVLLSGLDVSDWSRSASGLPGKVGNAIGGLNTDTKDDKSVVVLVRAVRVFASGGAAELAEAVK